MTACATSQVVNGLKPLIGSMAQASLLAWGRCVYDSNEIRGEGHWTNLLLRVTPHLDHFHVSNVRTGQFPALHSCDLRACGTITFAPFRVQETGNFEEKPGSVIRRALSTTKAKQRLFNSFFSTSSHQHSSAGRQKYPKNLTSVCVISQCSTAL